MNATDEVAERYPTQVGGGACQIGLQGVPNVIGVFTEGVAGLLETVSVRVLTFA